MRRTNEDRHRINGAADRTVRGATTSKDLQETSLETMQVVVERTEAGRMAGQMVDQMAAEDLTVLEGRMLVDQAVRHKSNPEMDHKQTTGSRQDSNLDLKGIAFDLR